MLNQNVCTREMVINDPPRKYMFRPDGTRVLSTRSTLEVREVLGSKNTCLYKRSVYSGFFSTGYSVQVKEAQMVRFKFFYRRRCIFVLYVRTKNVLKVLKTY